MAELYEPSAIQCGCSNKRALSFMKKLGFQLFDIDQAGDLKEISFDTNLDTDFNKVFMR